MLVKKCSHNRCSALGVGSKTMVAPPEPLELLIEGHTPADLEVLKSAEPPTPGLGNPMENADAAAIHRAAQVSPASTRSSAALHSLMEQGKNLHFFCSSGCSNTTIRWTG